MEDNKLLLRFRTNRYVPLADTRNAFLMIHWSSEKDRSRFFSEKGGEFALLQIFGFNATPLIQNYILKYHADNFPSDE